MNRDNLDVIKKSFVTKELAEKLKEKGFDLPVIALYDFVGDFTLYDYELREDNLITPLFSQATDWLRLKRNIFTYIQTDIIHGSEIHTGKIIGASKSIDVFVDSGDYYETYSKLIEVALGLIK